MPLFRCLRCCWYFRCCFSILFFDIIFTFSMLPLFHFFFHFMRADYFFDYFISIISFDISLLIFHFSSGDFHFDYFFWYFHFLSSSLLIISILFHIISMLFIIFFDYYADAAMPIWFSLLFSFSLLLITLLQRLLLICWCCFRLIWWCRRFRCFRLFSLSPLLLHFHYFSLLFRLFLLRWCFWCWWPFFLLFISFMMFLIIFRHFQLIFSWYLFSSIYFRYFIFLFRFHYFHACDMRYFADDICRFHFHFHWYFVDFHFIFHYFRCCLIIFIDTLPSTYALCFRFLSLISFSSSSLFSLLTLSISSFFLSSASFFFISSFFLHIFCWCYFDAFATFHYFHAAIFSFSFSDVSLLFAIDIISFFAIFFWCFSFAVFYDSFSDFRHAASADSYYFLWLLLPPLLFSFDIDTSLIIIFFFVFFDYAFHYFFSYFLFALYCCLLPLVTLIIYAFFITDAYMLILLLIFELAIIAFDYLIIDADVEDAIISPLFRYALYANYFHDMFSATMSLIISRHITLMLRHCFRRYYARCFIYFCRHDYCATFLLLMIFHLLFAFAALMSLLWCYCWCRRFHSMLPPLSIIFFFEYYSAAPMLISFFF